MSNNDWPFAEDGVKRDEFAESLRLPIIHNPYPRWCYITAVMVGEYPWDKTSVRPTDDELRAIASFHQEYLNHWYNKRWLNRMAQKPFDLDGSANMVIFLKRPDGGFAYRKGSWNRGPEFVPERNAEPAGLVQVMDRIHTIGDGEPMQRWTDWKTQHADVFAAVTA